MTESDLLIAALKKHRDEGVPLGEVAIAKLIATVEWLSRNRDWIIAAEQIGQAFPGATIKGTNTKVRSK